METMLALQYVNKGAVICTRFVRASNHHLVITIPIANLRGSLGDSLFVHPRLSVSVFTQVVLPNASNPEPIQLRVDADDGNVIGQSLRSDHAVEGIAVLALQSTGAQPVLNRHNAERITSGSYTLGETRLKDFGIWKLTQPNFSRDLPGRRRRDDQLIPLVQDNLSCDTA